MGYMRHHAILVTGADYPECADWFMAAYALAEDLGCEVSPISRSAMNGYRSFAVFPDGSKEGWDDSDTGDTRRAALIRWMDDQRHSDHSTGLRWVEVQYGDDEGVTCVVRHSEDEGGPMTTPPWDEGPVDALRARIAELEAALRAIAEGRWNRGQPPRSSLTVSQYAKRALKETP